MAEVRIKFTGVDDASDEIKRIRSNIDKAFNVKQVNIYFASSGLNKVKTDLAAVKDRSIKLKIWGDRIVGFATAKRTFYEFTRKAHEVKLKAHVTGIDPIRNSLNRLKTTKDVTVNVRVNGLNQLQQLETLSLIHISEPTRPY